MGMESMRNKMFRIRKRFRTCLTSMTHIIFLIIALSTTIECIEGANYLNPINIGIRSAIARVPNVSSKSQCIPQRETYHKELDITKYHQSPFNNDKKEYATSTICRGGASASPGDSSERRLHFYEAMICGAVSRSVAQTIMHPANTMKTILQSRSSPGSAPLTVGSFAKWENFKQLTRGAGAQLLLSMPQGAVNFAVLEFVRRQINNVVSRSRHADTINRNFGAGMDFLSSAVSTVCCSVVSTPQMVICDNIMAGTYPNLAVATSRLVKEKGVAGFYTGWWPGLAGKIPSYGLTWALFEEIKRIRTQIFHRPAKDIENSIMGCLASAATVCIMMPMDTVKTRLVTQMHYPELVPYKGINDCIQRIITEEGFGAFYRGLTPRLVSVVPMIGIQFGVYEAMKKFVLKHGGKPIEPPQSRSSNNIFPALPHKDKRNWIIEKLTLQEMAVESAALLSITARFASKLNIFGQGNFTPALNSNKI